MFGFEVGNIGSVASAKANFFDRKTVHNAADRATRRVLSRFGAFVRTRDRSSQRRRKGVSKPGGPPSAHVGLVRDLTFFAYDAAKKSVVIGPAKINRPAGALAALEQGGAFERMFKGKRRTLTYRARPHTRPAFDVELRKMPAAFKDEVR